MNSLLNNDNESTSDSSESDEDYKIQIKGLIKKAKPIVIPENSKRLYELQYEKFEVWCKETKVTKVDEKILLSYFEELSKKFKATSLCAVFCKLKPMLALKRNIDIGNYKKLQRFLKTKSKHHPIKKSKIFTYEEVSKFINDAPDDEYLLHKVVLIMGVQGCLRRQELLNLNIKNIKLQGSLYHITIPTTRTGVSKSFVTSEEHFPIIEKYMKLRPEDMQRLFLQIRNKKCTRQHVGKGKISIIPQQIAKFLDLPEPERYTGHAFRRTSASFFAHKSFKKINASSILLNKPVACEVEYVNIKTCPEELDDAGPSKGNNLTQEELKESDNVMEDESEEVTNTNISPNIRLIKNLKTISSEESQDIITSNILPKNKKLTEEENERDNETECTTQEEIGKIISSNLLGDSVDSKKKPIYIFKNCHFTINNKK